jgi:hypothetical protein
MAKSAKQQAAIAMSMKAAGKKPKMKMGGSNSELAAKYGNPNKITRGDIITAAKQNAGKMKMGGSIKSKKK